MNSFECYCLFTAVKLHFTADSYDFFKYNGKVRCKEETLARSGQKYFFEKVSRKYKTGEAIRNFFMANILTNEKIWMGNLTEENYLSWLSRVENIEYVFGKDISKLLDWVELNKKHFNDLFLPVDGQHPPLLKMCKREDILLETFVILERIFGFFKHFDSDLEDRIIWPKMKRRCLKYDKFFPTPDLAVFKKIIKEKMLLFE